MARAFAAQGARVHVCDIDAAAVRAASAEGLMAAEVDVAADPAAVDGWIDGTLKALGGLDVLVEQRRHRRADGARRGRCDGGVGALPVAIGVTSHYRTCARVIPSMKAARAGSIINISSTAGQYGIGMRAPYVAAEWEVIGLTKTLAIELGPVRRPRQRDLPASERYPHARRDRSRGDRTGSVVRGEAPSLKGQSIARFVQPDEIADTCLFLASDAAGMISGQAIAVDGHTETFHIG